MFDSSLVVIVDAAVNATKLRLDELYVAPYIDRLAWLKVAAGCLFNDYDLSVGKELNLDIEQIGLLVVD